LPNPLEDAYPHGEIRAVKIIVAECPDPRKFSTKRAKTYLT